MEGRLINNRLEDWVHVYKRREDTFQIFYSIRDFLVYFTLFCTVAKRKGVRVHALTLMYDHIHELISVDSQQHLKEFEREVNSIFAREWNRSVRVCGSFFAPFGSALKRGEKYIRNAVAYLANNPVERHLVPKVEDYRWNFLAYALSEHPFSEGFRSHHCSSALELGIKQVRYLQKGGHYLDYPALDRLVSRIPESELPILTDTIISIYNIIDYPSCVQLYGDFQTMLTAINANTGNEHDIKEVFTGTSDRVYLKMMNSICKKYALENYKSVICWPTETKAALIDPLRRASGASYKQACKFLHYTAPLLQYHAELTI